MSTSAAVREKAASLFRFLREVVQLRTTSARSVAQYERDGQVIWLADVPREPQLSLRGVAGRAGHGDEATWLEVTKCELRPHPAPPELLRPWLDAADLADSDLTYPDLRESVPAGLIDPDAGDDGVEVSFEDAPGVFDAWSRYVEELWQPWAAEDRRNRRVQDPYNDLFSIHQTLLVARRRVRVRRRMGSAAVAGRRARGQATSGDARVRNSHSRASAGA